MGAVETRRCNWQELCVAQFTPSLPETEQQTKVRVTIKKAEIGKRGKC